MDMFMKKGIIFSIIILCALNIVNSSSGVSQFHTNRGVEMRVVDSEDALISLPKEIVMDIRVLRQIINYYKLSTIYVSEKSDANLETEGINDSAETDSQSGAAELSSQIDALDTADTADAIESSEVPEVKETKVAVEVKELVDTEEKIDITGNRCNLIIKNNMGSNIRLEKIEFDDPCMQSHVDGLLIGVGDNVKVTINYNDNTGIYNGSAGTNQFESKATLCFTWDKGKSTIYQDVIINVTIEDKESEEVIL